MVGGGGKTTTEDGGGVSCCPKCKSTNIKPTGKRETRGGILYIEYLCDDCGHKWWVPTKEMLCPSCGSRNIKPTGRADVKNGIIWTEFVCDDCGHKWWLATGRDIPRCPKCNSTNVAPTGKIKQEKGFTYEEWKCADCQFKWWVRDQPMFCPICGFHLKTEMLERTELKNGYEKIKIKITCTNKECTGTFQKEIKEEGGN